MNHTEHVTNASKMKCCPSCGKPKQIVISIENSNDKCSSPSNKSRLKISPPIYSDAVVIKFGQSREKESNFQETQRFGSASPAWKYKTDQSPDVFEGHFPPRNNRQVTIVQYNIDTPCPPTDFPPLPTITTTGRTMCIEPPHSAPMTSAPSNVNSARCSKPPAPSKLPAPSNPPDLCSSQSTSMVAHCPAYDYLTFNQFQELKQLSILPCEGSIKSFVRFAILLLMTIVYFYLTFLLLLYLIEKLQIGFLGFELDSMENEGATTATRVNKKFWEVIKPKKADLWRQSSLFK